MIAWIVCGYLLALAAAGALGWALARAAALGDQALEHRHRFEPIIDRPPHLGGFEIITGYRPCACGKTWSEWHFDRARDPLANARAALALYRRADGARPWHGWPPR